MKDVVHITVRIGIAVARVDFFQTGILKNVGTVWTIKLCKSETAEIKSVCDEARGSEFRRKNCLLLREFRLNKNSEKGDDVTVVTRDCAR